MIKTIDHSHCPVYLIMPCEKSAVILGFSFGFVVLFSLIDLCFVADSYDLFTLKADFG